MISKQEEKEHQVACEVIDLLQKEFMWIRDIHLETKLKELHLDIVDLVNFSAHLQNHFSIREVELEEVILWETVKDIVGFLI